MSRTRSRRTALLAIVAALSLAFAACGGGDDGGDAAGTTTTTRRRATTTTAVPVVAPLTGLEDPTGTSAGRGPLWVKIDNANLERRPPQAGLEVADVVYEEPVEGITRFLALFHSTLPERIGPVRSTRFIDPGIVWHLGGLYVYSGGTADKVAAIKASPAQTVDENGLQASGSRVRDPAFRAPHNLFVLPEALWAWSEVRDRTPPEPQFEFLSGGEAFGGDPASLVEIPNESRARYRWDPARSTWAREALNRGSSGPVPHEVESGATIAPTNVIVQAIRGLEDKSVMVGDGDAWICSQGRCVTGRWSRASLEVPTVFTDAGGTPVSLAPGTTWIHLVTRGAPTITP
jgi:hypothetical protein